MIIICSYSNITISKDLCVSVYRGASRGKKMMVAPIVKGVLGIFYDMLIPQEKKSFNEILRSTLHCILFGCIMVVVSQQITLLNDLYAMKQEEYVRSGALYVEEQCASYKGSSQARIRECSDLSIIINSWPIARAISVLVRGWNTCLYMPCNELVRNIADQLQYKIAFIIIALAISSYLFNFFSCIKTKSSEFKEKYRIKQAYKDILSRQQQQNTHIPIHQ